MANLNHLPLRKNSAWSEAQCLAFLTDQTIPLRISVIDGKGVPLICSLWHSFQQGDFWCVTHRNAKLAKLVMPEVNCAFEVATNEPPYRGVRGQGQIQILNSEDAKPLLQTIMARFLGQESQALQQWLLSRSDEEVVLRITPTWITSWDYSERMS